MDLTGLPPRRERPLDAWLDRAPLIASVCAAGVVILLSGPGDWPLPVGPFVLFFQAPVLGTWWMLRLYPRMRRLASVPMREDLWLASIPAWNYLERELETPLARCRACFRYSTIAWFVQIFAWWLDQATTGTARANETNLVIGVSLFVLGAPLVAEQMAGERLARLSAWNALARMVAGGSVARTAGFRSLLHGLVLLLGPVAFLFAPVFLAGVVGGLAMFVFYPFCFWFAWFLGKRAEASRERAVEGYYRFE